MLHVFLLGKFRVQYGQRILTAFKKQKAQELFCFLLLYRNQPQTREFLANLLWEHASSQQSKSYLRKTLWQLQSAIESATLATEPPVLLVTSEWVQINPAADIWLDVALFEDAFLSSRGKLGRDLQEKEAGKLRGSVQLYQGELITGWFADWCIFERERFQRLYLILLDKLLDYSITHADFENGIMYGSRILKFDMAHERTHRQLMCLYYIFGDRTMAMRQYETCVAVLKKDLNVPPTEKTKRVLQKIMADQNPFDFSFRKFVMPWSIETSSLNEIMDKLDHIQDELITLRKQISNRTFDVNQQKLNQDRLEIRAKL
ncbi:MAG: hypothetical protein DWQ04_27200 [Chloroflexi bacterium]|nr:MAG: hypothetical protein DWQ04_27200 [Chloroflexota bacterium]